VPLDCAGKRFDQALAEMFPEYSRSRLAEWIRSGDARLGGEMVRPRDPVRGGETVHLALRTEVETDALPEAIALDIVYQDADVLVVDKPAGLVVHPGAGNPRGTLVNALLHFDPRMAELPRAGIVHRLDKDTSGLMVVGRTLPAVTGLMRDIASRVVSRKYLALVHGRLKHDQDTIEAPIGRDQKVRVRMAVIQTGKWAKTDVDLVAYDQGIAAVRCTLHTGRTHQIRVHMQYAKHPLIGDPLYGGSFKLPKAATPELADALRAFKRQALHAEKLAFVHPVSGEALMFSAERPPDQQALIEALRADLLEHGSDFY
jgi:23S rRNA pseudouridine1911/1915/1917 synthase